MPRVAAVHGSWAKPKRPLERRGGAGTTALRVARSGVCRWVSWGRLGVPAPLRDLRGDPQRGPDCLSNGRGAAVGRADAGNDDGNSGLLVFAEAHVEARRDRDGVDGGFLGDDARGA